MNSHASPEAAPVPALEPYRYAWPRSVLAHETSWRSAADGLFLAREMPETTEALARDSRWPAFFPSSICVITASDGTRVALEKVVGASVVNRFPYVIAISICVRALSARHHPRTRLAGLLESGASVALQFLPPGAALDRVLATTNSDTDEETFSRLERTGLAWRRGATSAAAVLHDAYLIYEARLARSDRDFHGQPIYQCPWEDAGSHRVFFLEVTAIQLRSDIARGETQISWRSLPVWHPRTGETGNRPVSNGRIQPLYEKGYTPHYRFPSAGTIAFAPDREEHGRAIKLISRQSRGELMALSNDEARWPCFFPSSVGMITTLSADGVPNLMPCGSTTVVGRHPLMFALCVSYADINERYAPRASLEVLRTTRRFVCGVPYICDWILDAIRYAGNVSIDDDAHKLSRTGLVSSRGQHAPILHDLPVQYECDVVREIPLGTHVMFLGEVQRILVRTDVTPDNPLQWYPWAELVARDA